MTKEVSKKAFKLKTINQVIDKKITDWLKTYIAQCETVGCLSDEAKKNKNQHLEKIKNSVIVTGGAIASMLQGDLPNDYDIYFQDVDILAEMVENYLKIQKVMSSEKVKTIEVRKVVGRVELFIKSAGVIDGERNTFDEYQYFEQLPGNLAEKYFEGIKPASAKNDKYVPNFMSSNAISLTDDIQIVMRFVGPVDQIHDNYDFVHCTNYWTARDGCVVNIPALMAVISKELKYVGSKYPICSMFRIRKFIERGWTITAGETLKIAYDVNKLDLDDISVLRDQLTGVDVAYFYELLRAMKDKDPKEIDRTFLFETINRIFDM